MPAFDSVDGIGQFLWLPNSMKNGSIANNSEMKLPAHTGTHVDAPGHVFDHYFDAGFDVDTLDLDVLNDSRQKSKQQSEVYTLTIYFFSAETFLKNSGDVLSYSAPLSTSVVHRC
ncbi:hypothetical protein ACLB2K_016508 [Fragaria x ananassa]